jgi:hypothetical protein
MTTIDLVNWSYRANFYWEVSNDPFSGFDDSDVAAESWSLDMAFPPQAVYAAATISASVGNPENLNQFNEAFGLTSATRVAATISGYRAGEQQVDLSSPGRSVGAGSFKADDVSEVTFIYWAGNSQGSCNFLILGVGT